MNRYFVLAMSALCLLCGGCFKNKQAPHRPVTAKSFEQAVELKESVERIEMTGAKIGDLPENLAAMPNLAILLLRGAELGDLSVLSSISKLTTLDISSTGQTNLPLSVVAASGLKQLYLADNKIETLSGRLGSLSNLEYINLDRNQLTALPDEIGGCVKVRWLRLNNNKLTELPASVNEFKQLQRIYLTNNQFTAVPDVLKDLLLLEDIDLSHNPVAEIPDWLVKLPRLKQLNFDHCKITKLPEDLSTLSSLQVLSLGHCPVPKEEKDRLGEALPNTHIAF